MEAREQRELERAAKDRRFIKLWVKIAAGSVVGIIALVLLVSVITPQINLYRKNTEKQAVIAEQKAKSQAAEYAAKSAVTQAQAKADAEVIRAQGLADSQGIIAETLSEEYLRYLYINALADGNGQIIYVPTEAGLPILEAGRSVPTTTPQGGG